MGIIRYQLGEDESDSIQVKLLYVTHSKYENDWSSLLHTHYFTELFYVLKGHGNFIMEGETLPIHTNDVVIVNANVPHTEKSIGDEPLEYIILGVEGLAFRFQNEGEHIVFNCKGDKDNLIYHFNILLEELRKKERDYEMVCQNILEVLIIRLIRRAGFTFEAITSVKTNRECLKLKQYMDANYFRNITLDTLSELSHLNKYYLVHAFTKQFGCSPINYLCDIRIKVSKELLSSTDHSITEISHLSGFSSQSYFAQCFQKNCSMTASAYRKTCRGN